MKNKWEKINKMHEDIDNELYKTVDKGILGEITTKEFIENSLKETFEKLDNIETINYFKHRETSMKHKHDLQGYLLCDSCFIVREYNNRLIDKFIIK